MERKEGREERDLPHQICSSPTTFHTCSSSIKNGRREEKRREDKRREESDGGKNVKEKRGERGRGTRAAK